MTELSQDQEDKRASIEKSAMIWGIVVAVIVGLIAVWALGSLGSAIRFGGAAVLAAGAGVLTRNASFNSAASSAKCVACGAAFSRSRTDRNEVLSTTAPKEERKDQDDGTIEVTTWTEEVYDVTDTFTCSKCGDAKSNTYQTTRRKDEATATERRKKSASDEVAKEAAAKKTADAPPEETAETPAPKKKSSDTADPAPAPGKKKSGGRKGTT